MELDGDHYKVSVRVAEGLIFKEMFGIDSKYPAENRKGNSISRPKKSNLLRNNPIYCQKKSSVQKQINSML